MLPVALLPPHDVRRINYKHVRQFSLSVVLFFSPSPIFRSGLCEPEFYVQHIAVTQQTRLSYGDPSRSEPISFYSITFLYPPVPACSESLCKLPMSFKRAFGVNCRSDRPVQCPNPD